MKTDMNTNLDVKIDEMNLEFSENRVHICFGNVTGAPL